MHKKIMFFLFLFSNVLSFSQDGIGFIPMELKSNRDFFQIVSEESKQITLFASDRKKVNVVLLNEKMEILDTLSTNRPEKKYLDIIGFSGKKSSPRLFWSNTDRDEIFSQFYDFKNRKIETLDYKLDNDKERFLQLYSENEKLFLLKLLKNSQILKLYIFDADGKLEIKSIDFSTIKIVDADGVSKDISSILAKNKSYKKNDAVFISPFSAFDRSLEIKKITYESPTSLTDSSKKIKSYTLNNKIIISFDEDDSTTQLLSIDLTTYEPAIKLFDKPYINNSENASLKSNSFLIDDKLFQVVTTSYQLKMVIKDLNNNILKEYEVNEGEPIKFKNSAMIRISPTGSERILDKTEQFLNKIVNFDFGVTCYSLNGVNTVTIGSVSDERATGYGVGIGFGGGSFGAMGAPGSFGFTNYHTFGYNYFSYTSSNYDSYANRKVIYTNCLFDKDFNHQNGEIKPLAFDKIKNYINDQDLTSPTLFKLANSYYLGFYEKNISQFRIVKFTE